MSQSLKNMQAAAELKVLDRVLGMQVDSHPRYSFSRYLRLFGSLIPSRSSDRLYLGHKTESLWWSSSECHGG
ncbi:MAG: hypothetical protein CL912_27920 [Deltaproteobacteria bacterium]|nr:hypothetical protein [Deltaproteobacteria bacterium]